MSNEFHPDSAQPSPQPVRVQLPDHKPYVTIVILVTTVLVFILQFAIQYFTGIDLLFLYGGKINQFILKGEVWRLITPAFLHGSEWHILINMYALFVIGKRLERFYGHWRLILLYFLSAFAGNVLSFVLSPASSLGASTAIFGLFAAEGVFIYQNRMLFGKEPTRQAIMNFGLLLIINLGFGFIYRLQVDNFGHIGGLLGGVFFAWKAGPILKFSDQPPFLSVIDARKKSDVMLASLVVLIGFTIIAMIPFFTNS